MPRDCDDEGHSSSPKKCLKKREGCMRNKADDGDNFFYRDMKERNP